jgi:PAS domain S-box-containing protein
MPVPRPPNETIRQAALDALRIVESSDDPFFGEVVALASRLLDAPISAVSLVDRDRQWFKAAVGLGVRETPRDIAFCAHAICGGEAFAVHDAIADPRFAENPLVTGTPFIRSYAGAPLRDAAGHALGTLCVIDQVPRLWSGFELEMLTSLAQMAMRHMETLALATRTLEVESLHETVISAMAEGVVVQTAAGEIRLANPAALSILGLTLDQITGKTSMDPGWQSLREDGSPFPGEDHPAMVTLKTGKSVDGVLMGVARPDGKRKWIKINSRPIFGSEGSTPIEAVTTFSDITEQREANAQLHSQRQRLNMALELGAIGVIERDSAAGEVRVFGHTETLKRFGPSAGASEGSFLERIPAERQTSVASLWTRHLAGGPSLKLETPISLADGTQRWALVGAEKLVDAKGRVTGALVAMKDIEERKQAEFALMDSLQKLENASRAKDVFLANISHEIRTPLNGVIGMASALEMTALTPEHREMVSLISSSGEVLDRLLSDLLDMSRLDAGKVTLEPAPFDLCAAVVESSQLFEIRATDKKLRFSLELAADAYGAWVGDKVRIKQIVSNLVSNAIKFTSSGQVQVRLSATGHAIGEGFDWVTLEVEDTGPGIPEDLQDRIFDRFEQVKSPASGQSGTGLGLSICKSLVSLMGGEIAVASQLGLGSTFTVRLPLTRAAEGLGDGCAHSDAQPAKGKLMRVLLVDDHPTNQRVVEAMLRAFDCEIVTAADGAQGLEAFQSGAFDLVLMDMSMPVMDGVSATRAIRAFEHSNSARRTPLAMLTAYGSEQHKQEAQEAGADFHILKPVTPVSLLAGLEKAIRASKANEAA